MQNDFKIILGCDGNIQMYRRDDIKNVLIEPQSEENGKLKISIICSHQFTNYFVNNVNFAVNTDKTKKLMEEIVNYLFYTDDIGEAFDMYEAIEDCLK